MQHQGRDDAARDARDEVLVLEVAKDVKLARGARRAATLDRRHAERYVITVPLLLAVRYRSVISDDARSRILASASNARLHSATYLFVRGRHCRRAVVASLVAELRPPSRFLLSFARSPPLVDHSWLCRQLCNTDQAHSATHAEHRHTVRPGSASAASGRSGVHAGDKGMRWGNQDCAHASRREREQKYRVHSAPLIS